MSDKSIQSLKNGLYEQLLSQETATQLEQAVADHLLWAERKPLDPQDAVPHLAHYVAQLLQHRLKELADQTETDDAKDEIELTNACIQFLFRHDPTLEHAYTVALHDSLLLSLQHAQNAITKIDWPRPDTSLSHSFLFTNSQKDVNIATELAKEIASSDRIDLLVSFIKFSGLTMILPALRQFTRRGGHLRVITTTYMGATDPRAVLELAKLEHTEVRISYDVKETRLHAKSYMFYRDSGYSTAYIGSSNLSHAAIADGLEWNIKITAQDQPRIVDKMQATFETYWHSPDFEPFSASEEERLWSAIDAIRRPKETSHTLYLFDIHPYPYQQAILDTLQAERQAKDHWHNLLVAATGTGKTAISAFDYRQFATSRRPESTRLLFVAHREEILMQSLACYRQVLKDASFGELAVGHWHATHPDHLFMSIQMFNSLRFWERMAPDFYDMIVVDEFHHAAAPSYAKLLSHFHPKILLGLTATPERMDGKSILSYFDNHISAEIRLPDAIERRLLCPFHYFGTEDPIDLSRVKWRAGKYDEKELEIKYATDALTARKRADAILQAIERYTADVRDLKALGFCVSKRHAKYMADYMQVHGLRAQSLDADTPDNERKAAKEKLETGELQILFVVDLFNEGVDIPAVNTVLFLRPTNSITVFLQQLGRGLRLSEGKDCLTVLDFVAQSNRNYDFASRFAALLGRPPADLSKEIRAGFPHAPKGCCIQLEEIAQQRVLKTIRDRLSKNEFFKEQIRALHETTGTVPTLSQFLQAVQISAESFYNGRRLYTRLCADAGVRPAVPNSEEADLLQKQIPRFLSMDSPRWIQFLQKELATPYLPTHPVEQQYLRMWQYTLYGKDAADCAMTSPLDVITRFTKDTALVEELTGLLSYLYNRMSILPQPLHLLYPCALEVHCHYTRDQLLAALGYQHPGNIREGVKYLPEKQTDVFLVTLNKSSKEFSDTTLYEDYSIDSTLFHWQSQNSTSPESPTGQRYIHQREQRTVVLFFVRERKKDDYGNAMSYTFLGPAHYVSHTGSRPMTIIYRLETPIPACYLPTMDSSGVL